MNGEIYVYVSATGIVYSSTGDRLADSIQFVRLDKTEHYGYNINAFQFNYQNQLYSIGGYGFWHWNGQLRRFSEKSHEWDVLPVNKEYPVGLNFPGSYFWISENMHSLYAFSYIEGNEVVKLKRDGQINKIDSVLELDLKTMDWKTKGLLNNNLKNTINSQYFIANLDSGILIRTNSTKLVYLNLVKNRIDSIDNTEVYHFFANRSQDDLFWYKSGYFYKANPQTSELDSLQFNLSILKKGYDQVYLNTISKASNNNYLYMVLLAPVLFLFFRKKSSIRKINSPLPNENDDKLNSPYKNKGLFDEVEKSLIILIYQNATLKGERTGTEEVNRILGVGNKTNDMQKRKRSDIIKSINKKYQMIQFDNNKILIDRIKSEIDARLYEYVLTTDNLNFIE